MKHKDNTVDIIVIGGGHAGLEAALAAERLGLDVFLITMDKSALGRMSCNPAIGGIAKGQMVREIDVLGGVMGRAADASCLQFKMLNRSKGKSVWSPRAQVDKRGYEQFINHRIHVSKKITIIEGEVVSFVLKSNTVCGVELRCGHKIRTRSVVVTCGTFLNGLVHIGNRKIRAGRMGENISKGITEFLVSLGFTSGRLKTGTPPRLISNTINWEKLSTVFGDKEPTPFSYSTTRFAPPNDPCYIAHTNPACHESIHKDIRFSPLYSGDVSGTGPRYCPSIEDKINRFNERDSHTLFLEPEWKNSNQIYTNGFSTSLPEKTQINALRKIRGLENVEFFRPGYAIEYDFFPSSQLKSSLESKNISGLYFAGQINGTSGYEEAAAQGLIAGANAGLALLNRSPVLLSREDAYIGVLMDDLVTKDTLEPYRMFTSRAEYRLLLRFTNTGKRLADKSFNSGLINQLYYDQISQYFDVCSQILRRLDLSVTPAEMNSFLIKKDEPILSEKVSGKKLLKRPAVGIHNLPKPLFEKLNENKIPGYFKKEMFLEAETTVKYSGYIKRQEKQIEKLKKQESFRIPPGFNYMEKTNLSMEAREKLALIRPETLGQAIRVSGVTPADASVLSVYIVR